MQALVECGGDSIDLSGDMGAVGRVVISDTPSGNHEMYLDLKGKQETVANLPCIIYRSAAGMRTVLFEFHICQVFRSLQ